MGASSAAKPVADGTRPTLDGCAALLVAGRAWHSDMVFSQVDGVPQEGDIGIDDGTTEETFQLRRAATDYARCVKEALPEAGPGRSSVGTRMIVASGGKAGASAPKGQRAKPEPKPRASIQSCFIALKSVKSWEITADFSFTSAEPPKVKGWSISGDVSKPGMDRRLLTGFARCLGQSLQVSQKPVIK